MDHEYQPTLTLNTRRQRLPPSIGFHTGHQIKQKTPGGWGGEQRQAASSVSGTALSVPRALKENNAPNATQCIKLHPLLMDCCPQQHVRQRKYARAQFLQLGIETQDQVTLTKSLYVETMAYARSLMLPNTRFSFWNELQDTW